MLHLPEFYRRNSHDELLGMACYAPWNFRTAAAPFSPRIPAPLAQTVRQVSMRTIPDLLETLLITTAGFAEKLTKNADWKIPPCRRQTCVSCCPSSYCNEPVPTNYSNAVLELKPTAPTRAVKSAAGPPLVPPVPGPLVLVLVLVPVTLGTVVTTCWLVLWWVVQRDGIKPARADGEVPEGPSTEANLYQRIIYILQWWVNEFE